MAMSLSRIRTITETFPGVQRWVFSGIAMAALATAAVARLRLDLADPLWLDESWTGAFASQSSLVALTEQVRNDPNGPAYYYLIWIWARAFGLSNVALHVPSLVISLVTPAIAWAGMKGSRPILALTWAVLLACWIPALDQSDEARCYAMLSCAAVISTMAHLHLLRRPSLRRGTAWAGCAAFMTLVHYHAGILALAQGLSFVMIHRRRALRLWPAALPFLPAFAWISWHLPRIVDFAKPGVAWYRLLPVVDVPLTVIFLIGGPLTPIFLVIALALGLLLGSVGDQSGRDDWNAALWWAGGTAVAAACLCIAVGVWRPTFTYRYLTPFAPGTLLLVAAWATREGRAPYVSASVLLVGPLVAVALALAAEPVPAKRIYNFETASAWLAQAKPARLVFFWDHPSTPVMAKSQLDVIGGFFLRRAGLTLGVTPLYPTAQDMNGPVSSAAGQDAAVLWIYDVLIHDTTARIHPPRLSSLDPGLECRNFGAFNIGVVACRRSPDR